MLFNSFSFLVFFPVVYLLFFATRGKARLSILFLASCIFYMWFVPKYVVILFFVIALDFYAALQIEASTTPTMRKRYLLLGILSTCSLLFVFKYHNFFVDNINTLTGTHFSLWSFILPIGLSFHTFQSLSYIIDVYRKKVPAEHSLLIYSNYVMMFPQLVAGPIERAKNILPQMHTQMYNKLSTSDFTIGMTLFFYGLFKKMVVADNIGPYVDAVYNNHSYHSGTTLAVATMLFSIQIYADFSGYTDMAIGIARVLGFRFSDNFKTPYFTGSITEFWRHWHITLSSWLRDYLYYPLVLGWGRVTRYKIYASTLITFTLIGLWHGANWTYVLFGTLHGVYLVFEMLLEKVRKDYFPRVSLSLIPSFLIRAARMMYVFVLVSAGFVLFRAKNLSEAGTIYHRIATDFHLHELNFLDTNGFAIITFSCALLFLLEYFTFTKYSIDDIFARKRGEIYCATISITSILLVLSFAWFGGPSFIYFQF
jgi:alginate O-acetyltransferase complex protein AlgI